jgi:hypothetical protein
MRNVWSCASERGRDKALASRSAANDQIRLQQFGDFYDHCNGADAQQVLDRRPGLGHYKRPVLCTLNISDCRRNR